jgi:hypothetical protein
MKWDPVRITPPQNVIDYADNVAALRRSRAFLWRLKNADGLVGDFDTLLAMDRMGARCEAAGKLYLNPIHWHACTERFKGAPDLGDFIDVKGRYRDTDDLIIQKDDQDRFAYLFVSAEHHPDYLIFGWAWGHEAKQEQWWRDPRGRNPAYFMPVEDLPHPPDELLSLVQKRSAA